MLNSLFLSKARISVLKTLLLEPDGRFYLRELAQKAELPLRSVQVEVKRLTEAGILECETSGRQTYYKVNEQCPIIPELRSIFIKTVGVADAIRSALLPASESIFMAFIYGSFARGDIRADSDVDLFIVGDITLRKVTVLLKNINVARVINPTIMSIEELNSQLDKGNHFICTIMSSPKIMLIGDEDGIARFN